MSRNISSTIQPSIPIEAGDTTLGSAADMLIVDTFFTALLVPIAVIMFYFSSPRLRRRPVFILNVLAIALGLGMGAITMYSIRVRISLQPVSLAWSISTSALITTIPMVVQSVLLVRVVAVYPPRSLSWKQIFYVYGPFVVLKTARVINICVGIVKLTQAVKGDPLAGLDAGSVAWNLPYYKVELFLQLVDDTYTSSLFLLRLRQGGAFGGGAAALAYRETGPLSGSYASRLKTLAWIAVFNFVFPVFFSISQLVIIFRDRNYIHGVSVQFAGTSVVVIGVLLATIWHSEQQTSAPGPAAVLDTLPRTVKVPPIGLKNETQLESASETSSDLYLFGDNHRNRSTKDML